MNKKLIKNIALILCLLLTAVLFAGCGSTTQESTSGSEGSTPVETTETLSVRIGLNSANAPLLQQISLDKGLFEEENLDVEIISFNSTSDGIAALEAGKVDVSYSFGSNSPLQYISAGSDLTFYGGYLSNGHPIVTTEENAGLYDNSSRTAFANSFKGKTVGILRLYTSAIVWQSALQAEGIDTEKDLTIVEFKKPADLVAAVSAGQVDVGVIASSGYTMAKEAGLSIVGFSQDLWENHICCRAIADTKYYAENHEALVRLTRALLKAEKIYREDPDYGAQLWATNLGIDLETSEGVLFETGQKIDLDPNRKGIISMYNTMVDQGLIENEYDIDSHIDTSIYQEAIESLYAETGDSFYADLLTQFEELNA